MCKMGLKNFVVLFLFSLGTCLANNYNDEVNLREELFKEYNKDVIPIDGDEIDRVQLSLGLHLNYFLDLDPKTGMLSNGVWIKFQWKDFRLSWDSELHGGIGHLRVSSSQLWLPDIEAFNGYEELPRSDVNALIYSDGSVYWVPIIKRLTTSCDMGDAIAMMAKGEGLVCNITLGSWTYDHNTIELSDEPGFTVEDGWGNNPAVELVSSSAALSVDVYPCCPDEEYSKIVYSLHLKPKPWAKMMMMGGGGGRGGMGQGQGGPGGDPVSGVTGGARPPKWEGVTRRPGSGGERPQEGHGEHGGRKEGKGGRKRGKKESK